MNEDELMREEREFVDRRDVLANGFIRVISLIAYIGVLIWVS